MAKEFFDPITKRMTTSEDYRRRLHHLPPLQPVKGDVTFKKPATPSADGEPRTIDVEVEQVPPRKRSTP